MTGSSPIRFRGWAAAVLALACSAPTAQNVTTRPKPSCELGNPVPLGADRAAPGCLLREGMELVYEANGEAGEPWIVERVRVGVRHAGRTDCSLIVFAARGAALEPEVRWRHRGRDLLHGYANDPGQWSVLRPLGPNMSWVRSGPSGRMLARYTTGNLTFDQVGEYRIGVVETTVETFDEQGRVTRRLREAFAPGLDTATRGVFEIPDAVRSGEWEVTLSFALREIR